MISAIKTWIYERIIVPRALHYLKQRPERLTQLLAALPEDARDALYANMLPRAMPVFRADPAFPGMVLDDETLWKSLLRGLLSERTLAQSAVARIDTLLRHAAGNLSLEDKIAQAVARLAANRSPFRQKLRWALYESDGWITGVVSDRVKMSLLYRAQGNTDWNVMLGWGELHRFIVAMRPWLAEDAATPDVETQLEQQVNAPVELRKAFHAVVCTNNEFPMRRARLQLPDAYSFWPQLFEIFVREDYDFDCDTSTPYIIDAGMHMGLATYYFKTRFPSATVLGFEPSPQLRPITEENIRRCGFEGVTVEPYALNGVEGILKFHLDPEDSMAGSLISESADGPSVEVQAVRLSPYLDRPVDFLKLDIEGAEGAVLAEAAGHLKNVHHLFIEYHEHFAPELNSLSRILSILDAAGFDYEIGKSHGYQLLTERSPMKHVGATHSSVVFAKNRVWPPAEAR